MPNFKTQHITDWTRNELETLAKNQQLIDVRTAEEYELGHVQGALLHPVQQIETFDLPKDRTYYIYCRSGHRSHNAAEALATRGYEVVNLDGGFLAIESASSTSSESISQDASQSKRVIRDYSGLQCPGPIVEINKEMMQMPEGTQLEVTVTDLGFKQDIQSWVKQRGYTLVTLEEKEDHIHAIIEKTKDKDMAVKHSENGTTIVLFSGELDKALAALIIANGAKAAGRDVSIFFTFWGLNALKKVNQTPVKKTGIAKMFDKMLPSQPEFMPISKMNMFGLGNVMMRYVMKKKNIETLPALIDQAIEQGVKLIACTMSMDVMGISKEELREEVTYGGVGAYIGDTEQARHNLFI
ncbi:DsrE/DsrF/DrsH-like family protein [Staphylococcus agnetis]|uniref:DsrE/DsrF/DrsH-like family protein n=1 Tax=Staphylococcus agnetis TaxID=985762 RepID=UPI000CD30EF3|nr:DsrE/DsrF/DrsH-like family protein [Staphylococcus agnetis]MBY7664308.1 DsrE/DsrF/DrsH-like family protein [Staphylococcus agnetis]NJH68581.1 dihydroneopterin aldolase [Staphylococcus agnetis]PNY84293.1 dihydroneopterin aldolase [Staphylococcus agnetis]PTH67916.1 dihydroneopterin aldolase [Staphylococcus agnetis]TRW82570.1 dihydroneopterin aldolase [Staphylococcus agnetis]